MRVCLVSAEYPPQQGGVGDYTRELALALRRQGVDAIVLTGQSAGTAEALPPSTPRAPRKGEISAPSAFSAVEDSVPVERRIRGWGWRAWGDLHRALGALSPHIVHIQYQAAAYGLHPAINLWPRGPGRRTRTVVTFHDLRVPYLFPKAGALRTRAVVELARGSAQAIVTNAEDREALAPHLRQPPLLIPIGSNIHPSPPAGYDRAAWRARAGVGEAEVVLAYFGFLNESKGGEELVAALAALRGRNLPVSLWLIGGQVGASDPTNHAYLAWVRRQIAELALEPYVRWTGYMDSAEVSATLLAADLCVLPYRDGVSFRRGSLMAALAHGLPVVSTVPRLPLVEVVDGENMALVPPRDVAALSARLAALIADPAARRRLSEGARRLAGLFDWDTIAQQTVEAYDALA